MQFDVVTSRLQSEYNVEVATDRHGRRVLLFDSPWAPEYFQRHDPEVPLFDESPAVHRA